MIDKRLFNDGENHMNKLKCGKCGAIINQKKYETPHTLSFYANDKKTKAYSQVFMSFITDCCGTRKYLYWGIN